VIEPPRLRSGRFDILIETEGRLPFPPDLSRLLGLEPGDIIALRPRTGAVQISFYRQILTFPWDGLDPRARRTFALELLSFPLTALDNQGAVAIPQDLLPLPAGSRAVLSVTEMPGSSWPLIEVASAVAVEAKPGASARRGARPT